VTLPRRLCANQIGRQYLGSPEIGDGVRSMPGGSVDGVLRDPGAGDGLEPAYSVWEDDHAVARTKCRPGLRRSEAAGRRRRATCVQRRRESCEPVSEYWWSPRHAPRWTRLGCPSSMASDRLNLAAPRVRARLILPVLGGPSRSQPRTIWVSPLLNIRDGGVNQLAARRSGGGVHRPSRASDSGP
jgi:hypothetical protein